MVLDRFVERIYRTGCVQSVIANTATLLVLALVVVRPAADVPRVTLSLRFAPVDEPAVDLEELPAVVASEPTDTGVEKVAADSPILLPDESAPPQIEIAMADLDVPEDPQSDVPGLPALLAEIAPPSPRVQNNQIRQVSHHAAFEGHGTGDAAPGIGGELGRRLRWAGAKTGDVQVSIRWNDMNDIDLHVSVEPVTAHGPVSHISWINRFGFCGGILDVDANAEITQITTHPVENVFWAKGRAPYGRYTVMLHHFRCWSGRPATPVEVAVLVDGEVQWFYPTVHHGDGLHEVVSFVRLPKAVPVTIESGSPPEAR